MEKNNSLMRRLIQSYSIILIVIITLFAIIVSYVTTQSHYADARFQMNRISNKIPQSMEDFQGNLRRMVLDLFPNYEKVESLKDFFYMDLSAYYSQQLSNDVFSLFPKDVQLLYDRYDDVEGFIVTLDNSNDVYYSSASNKMGSKQDRLPDISGKFIISRRITNYDSYEALGYLYLITNYSYFDKLIESEDLTVTPSVFLLSENGKVKYSYNKGTGDALQAALEAQYDSTDETQINPDNRYMINRTVLKDGHILVVATLTSDVFARSIRTYAAVVAASLVLDGILLLILVRTFGSYDNQVNDILSSMNRVQKGEIGFRIETKGKEAELLAISNAVNMTLDSINAYVEEIYKLEIHQQEINLRALQSQINPHFLYNTLEFIRMYAVNEGVDELAEIVYTFSTLLRNNISLEKTTTLRKELDFCERYVYLHQMRFPNRIAYKFHVDASLEKIIVPKFTLQPIIENYFIHGIDYGSVENAISVRAYRDNGRVYIEVMDNGQGISDEKLEQLQEKINRSVFNVSGQNSVGLLNVHQRLKVYFEGYNYTMMVNHGTAGGFVVAISFDEEVLNV